MPDLPSEVTEARIEVWSRQPFEIIDVPAEVFKGQDDESIFAMMTGQLKERGLYKDTLVYTGFDGSFVRASGFRGRAGTYGWTEPTILEAMKQGSVQTPMSFMADQAAGRPAIGVFDPDKLRGGLTAHTELLNELGEDELKTPDNHLLYWAPRQGLTLDEAAVAVFMFRTEANNGVEYVSMPEAGEPPAESNIDQPALKLLSHSRSIVGLAASADTAGGLRDGIITETDRLMLYTEEEEPNPVLGSLKQWGAKSFPYREIMGPGNEPYTATFEVDLGAHLDNRGIDKFEEVEAFVGFGVTLDDGSAFAERHVIIWKSGKVDIRDTVRFSHQDGPTEVLREAGPEEKAELLTDLNELRNRAQGGFLPPPTSTS